MSIQVSDLAKENIWRAERSCSDAFARINSIETVTQTRVLEAFQNAGVAVRHFNPSTGYGYDDISRDTLDIVFSYALQSESALVRPQFVNGTHAIYTAIAGLTKPGDKILSVTGKPYDTLEEAIGIRGNAPKKSDSAGMRGSWSERGWRPDIPSPRL